jgi:hypothetical protein
MELNPECARVLGALVEKALTTPQQYPLTSNALLAACNQTSNREPVVSYDETTVQSALDELKDQHLVRFVLPSHGRSVIRYRHVLDEALGLDNRQSAILAMLMLRGPQTVGELRTRTERMAQFDHLREVEHELDLLGSREEPLAANVGRRPGQKEERWATPLVADAPDRSDAVTDSTDSADASTSSRPATAAMETVADDSDLRADLAGLRAEIAQLRDELQQLRDSLGG